MKAMIMAAGVGSRLMPLTINIPKPMIPVGNRPLMENTLNLLQEHNFKELIANLYHQPEIISSYFGDGYSFGVSMSYSLEEELRGTAGGVKKCQWFLDDTFLVISGDALTDINLTELLTVHRQKGSLATIALKEVEDVEQFGVVITDEDGKIKNFQEKPKAEKALSHKANTGIYIFEPEIFDYIPAEEFYDFGKQLFPNLVKMGAPFYGVAIDNYWCDVGNIDAYHQVHSDILEARIKTRKSGELTATIEGSNLLLGKDVSIGTNVRLDGNVVIGSGCRVGDNTVISNTVIWNNSFVGKNCTIQGAVLGSNCEIADLVAINNGAVVASNCTLQASSNIPAYCKVFNSSGGKLEMVQGDKWKTCGKA